MHFILVLWIFATGLLCGCTSSHIIRDKDYQVSELAYQAGDFEQARDQFPQREKGGFITSIEKNWLNFWDQSEFSNSKDGQNLAKRDLKELQSQVKTFDERQFISLSREAETFLFQESEEGYVPAEHEIVLLHLISAMVFMKGNLYSEAEVEVRQAGHLLQSLQSKNDMRYDDPTLRLWLAGLWTALGDWNSAQVDLRRVFELTGDLRAKKLADMDQPPKKLTLVFSGMAPKVEWKSGQVTPEFLSVEMPHQIPKKLISFNTHAWFQRHVKRNIALRDALMKSNYMAQYLGIKTTTTAEKVSTNIVSSGIKTAGIVIGVTIMAGGLYLLAASSGAGGSGTGDAVLWIMGIGWLAMDSIVKYANELQRDWDKNIKEEETRKIEDLHVYRYVRLMPQWLTLAVDDDGLSDYAALCGKSKVSLKISKSPSVLELINCPKP